MATNDIFYLTLAKPARANAFDGQLVCDLQQQLDTMPKETRVLIISGLGKHFSSGADLEWMLEISQQPFAQNKADAEALDKLLNSIANLPIPVIAITQGYAIGGALGLLAVADIVLAHTEAQFALTEVNLALAPCIISKYVINAIGPRHFKKLALLGKLIRVTEAEQIGLIHYVYDDNKEELLNEMIKQLVSSTPLALRSVKELAANPLLDRTSLLATLRTTSEARKRIAAFLAKGSTCKKS